MLKDCLYENNWERRVDGGDVSDGRASANSILDLNDRDTTRWCTERFARGSFIHRIHWFNILEGKRSWIEPLMAIFTKYPTKSKERMGKGKPRNGTDPVPEHKDVLKRMNFLFQAAHLLNLSGPSTYVPTAGHSGSSHTRPTTGLSRYYSGLSKKIGQKVVLRMCVTFIVHQLQTQKI